MHEEYPNVVRLQVHLPGEQNVVFHEDDDTATVTDRVSGAKSTLDAFFAANDLEEKSNGDVWLARDLLYQEFPQKFAYKRDEHKWSVRKRGFALGRMFFVPPTAGEKFFVRLLLTVVKGKSAYC
jgi:hypothetical protein